VLQPAGPVLQRLTEPLRTDDTLEVIDCNSGDEIFINAQKRQVSLILFYAKEREQLARAFSFLKRLKPLLQAGRVKALPISPFHQADLLKMFAEHGCAEVIPESTQPKTFRFKLNRYFKMLQSKMKSTVSNATQGDMRVRSQSGQNAEGKKGRDQSGGSSQAEIIDSLTIKGDFWVHKGGSALKVMRRWLVRLQGPSPMVGKWESKISEAGLQEWVWRSTVEAEQEKFYVKDEPGEWVFTGGKPDFQNNTWSFTGEKMELAFYLEGKKVARKFYFNDEGRLLLAADSKRTLSYIPDIIESIEWIVHLSKDEEKKEGDVQIGEDQEKDKSTTVSQTDEETDQSEDIQGAETLNEEDVESADDESSHQSKRKRKKKERESSSTVETEEKGLSSRSAEEDEEVEVERAQSRDKIKKSSLIRKAASESGDLENEETDNADPKNNAVNRKNKKLIEETRSTESDEATKEKNKSEKSQRKKKNKLEDGDEEEDSPESEVKGGSDEDSESRKDKKGRDLESQKEQLKLSSEKRVREKNKKTDEKNAELDSPSENELEEDKEQLAKSGQRSKKLRVVKDLGSEEFSKESEDEERLDLPQDLAGADSISDEKKTDLLKKLRKLERGSSHQVASYQESAEGDSAKDYHVPAEVQALALAIFVSEWVSDPEMSSPKSLECFCKIIPELTPGIEVELWLFHASSWVCLAASNEQKSRFEHLVKTVSLEKPVTRTDHQVTTVVRSSSGTILGAMVLSTEKKILFTDQNLQVIAQLSMRMLESQAA